MICPPGCGAVFIAEGLTELIVPAIWEQATFADKLGAEKEGSLKCVESASERCGVGVTSVTESRNIAPTYAKASSTLSTQQMWLFQDKGNRACCLVPEITAIVQETWRSTWSKSQKSLALFYIARCYRYDRPQAGRYREFTQVGVEWLGQPPSPGVPQKLLQDVLSAECPGLLMCPGVKRGLSYYTEDGFEVEAPWLGAQKQLAGGGRYQEGVGWAIGLDRLDLAKACREG